MAKSHLIDVEREELEPSTLEYDWAARHCGVQMKSLHVVSTAVGNVYKGGFLMAVESLEETENWKLVDTRRLTYDGKEQPPLREIVHINSKMSNSYLVEGLKFFDSSFGSFVLKFEETWFGERVTILAADDEAVDVLSRAYDWLEKNNPLKGEAFTLSGEFLTRKGNTFDDVILCDKNKAPLRKAVKLVNERGSAANNRGLIFAGPPGTGKTMSGRAIMNEAKATFIWVAAKDFWNMGATYGLVRAFELAKDLGPATIFIEDVDNWLSSTTIDVIKTEMDGIDKGSGVLTILTTNYPERLPKALIDRPGRFHEVLNFDVPNETQRQSMINRWLPDCDEKTVRDIVKRTSGLSGAHMYELCEYAKQIAEDDELSIDDAACKAVDKVHEQRKLIDAIQLQGSNYQPNKELLPSSSKHIFEEAKQMAGMSVKGGRTLSAKNRDTLQEVRDDLGELADKEELTRGGQALCKRCMHSLDKMLEQPAETPDDEQPEDEKPAEHTTEVKKNWTANEHAVQFLSKSTPEDQAKMLTILQGVAKVEQRSKLTSDYRKLAGSRS
jgi:hypothetical protein